MTERPTRNAWRSRSELSCPGCSSWVSQVCQTWSCNRRAWAWFKTVKAGSSPTSSARSRNKAAQKAWMVITIARSSSDSTDCKAARSASGRDVWSADSTTVRSRVRSSAAALSVKVITAIRLSGLRPVRSRASSRLNKSCVLPVPAPASSKNVV